MLKHPQSILGLCALGLIASGSSALAATATWDFSTDPTTGTNPIEIYQTGFADSSGNSVAWKNTGGNPGGFLGLTWSLDNSSTIVVFPDIDQGKLVTSFRLEADLRVGNPRVQERAADGFSVNFARSDDPVFTTHAPADFATGGAVETGTRTGISIIFDTWAGNDLPDGRDFTDSDAGGIIVRLDNKTLLRHRLPLYNGACNDPTSIQTGPRNAAYWAAVNASASNPDPIFDQGAYTNLCWQKLIVEVDTNSQVTVTYKGVTILDKFKTDFFPSPGGIILAGRTGGADGLSHFDNITLTTTSQEADNTKPTAPTALAATSTGSGRVALSWGASTDNSGRVAYDVERNGTVLPNVVTGTNFVDFGVMPGQSVTYRVRAKDVSLNLSDWVSLTVNTPAEVPTIGTLKAEIFDGISGTAIDTLTGDPKFTANTPDRVTFINGLHTGGQNGLGGWNNTYGDNFGMRVTGTLTPVESGQYNFFIRSDDASQFFLNTTGAALPNPTTDLPLVQELQCCSTFLEPGDANKPDVTTATPVNLTAGTRYGFVLLLKEGGGGDGAAVGMRKVGDTTPAPNVPAIGGLMVTGGGDPVGSTLNITTQPANTTVIANERATFRVALNSTNYYYTNLWFQWLRDGTPIANANSNNYVIPVVATTDGGARFSVVVGTEGIVRTSSVATLTVNADTKRPNISRAVANETRDQVTVTFSEPVTAPTATTAGNYLISGGVNVTAATQVNPFTIRLTTSQQAGGEVYTLTVNNVQDNAGNVVNTNNMVYFKSWGVVPNRAKMELWTGISGTAISALTDDPKFQQAADEIRYYGGLNTPDLGMDNYGARITAFLIPRESGQYNFFIRSDDASQFYINTNSETAFPVYGTDMPLIEELQCCSAFLEPNDANKPTVTTATPVSLTAGRRYPVMVMLKEGGGGDFVQVAMRKVGDATPAGSLQPLTSQIYWYGPDANVLAPNNVVVATSTNSPAAERATNAVDQVITTKYLNFDKLNSGFTITPAAASTIRGIALTSANDAPERDPSSYLILGSVNGGTNWTVVASNSVALFPDRFTRREYYFTNDLAYTSYRILFPTVVNAATANSMQIAEVELLGFSGGTLAVPPVANNPPLSVARDGTNIILTFEGTLQSADTVNGTYTDMPGASPMTVPTTGTSKFFRARR